MPWKETSLVSTREEFIRLALTEGANLSQLCKRFSISRKTAYKWIAVFRSQGPGSLEDRSRKPHSSPYRVSDEVEKLIMDAAEEHQAWGARKLHTLLMRQGHAMPAVSTVQAVLNRHGRVCLATTARSPAVGRFEHPEPNDLWQMDFKQGIPCRPSDANALTVLDDHSRYNLCLHACDDQTTETVQKALTAAFRTHGLPYRMTMDNGSPWGDPYLGHHTRLTVWLMKLGIRVSHSRPYHPQTQGKDERFHRTLKVELLQLNHYDSLQHAQFSFDQYRQKYNTVRPHEGIGMLTPIERYRPSPRAFPEILPTIEYNSTDQVRKVSPRHCISYKGNTLHIGGAFRGEFVAIRPTDNEHVIAVYFGTHLIHTFDISIHQ